jgi:hypothetical protein
VFNPTTLLADAFGRHLAETYRRTFAREPNYATALDAAARLAVERLANSDALYHDAHHTVMVTLVGQDILRGRLLATDVTPEDWLHLVLALLAHDVGYVRGACRGDDEASCVVDAAGNRVVVPRGASDAFLTPYHVERSKLFVRERLKTIGFIDEERVARAIELTRFPVPDDGDHAETGTEAGLVRAADLIGQLGDPLYLRRLTALYYEFAETGIAAKLGYANPADLLEHYPRFFWESVEPYIGDALRYLELTMEGKQWIANLYSHVFAVEHRRPHLGPQDGEPHSHRGVSRPSRIRR